MSSEEMKSDGEVDIVQCSVKQVLIYHLFIPPFPHPTAHAIPIPISISNRLIIAWGVIVGNHSNDFKSNQINNFACENDVTRKRLFGTISSISSPSLIS